MKAVYTRAKRCQSSRSVGPSGRRERAIAVQKFWESVLAKNKIPPGSSDYAPKKREPERNVCAARIEGDREPTGAPRRTKGQGDEDEGWKWKARGTSCRSPVNEVVGWERLQVGSSCVWSIHSNHSVQDWLGVTLHTSQDVCNKAKHLQMHLCANSTLRYLFIAVTVTLKQKNS